MPAYLYVDGGYWSRGTAMQGQLTRYSRLGTQEEEDWSECGKDRSIDGKVRGYL